MDSQAATGTCRIITSWDIKGVDMTFTHCGAPVASSRKVWQSDGRVAVCQAHAKLSKPTDIVCDICGSAIQDDPVDEGHGLGECVL